ncbi:hypothetical protein K504DRAFT_536830 [Pleomassaria siparia CBS 279.74]|uniref:Uncharacterized protein n=1 Tax=Pleomassaria siparia CBS 279.74 TaxID=1314801 RepID=A0A6G1K0E4_9PLEO|nr:hypothetical protein K504DRAFT_536830 [Pleomassaria siparia CBS 279.74]
MIPIMARMNWNPEELTFGPVPRDAKATVMKVLSEFISVHFHIHAPNSTSNPRLIVHSLGSALKIFVAHSAREGYYDYNTSSSFMAKDLDLAYKNACGAAIHDEHDHPGRNRSDEDCYHTSLLPPHWTMRIRTPFSELLAERSATVYRDVCQKCVTSLLEGIHLLQYRIDRRCMLALI